MSKWWSVVGLLVLFGITFSYGNEPKQMSQGAYSQARTIKICATAEGHVIKCGSGVFIERNKVLTAFHVVSPITVRDGPALPPRQVEAGILILRENATEFEEAILISSAPAYDMAIIRVHGAAPQAILHSEFWRGEKVWAVGNPGGRDFSVIETYVSGIIPMEFPGVGILNLIAIDAKSNKITHGFSGGGLFTAQGMIGIVQMCNEEADTCLALPTAVIQKQIERKNK